MKQDPVRGAGGYKIMIARDGTVTFDGMDEGRAISKYEPRVKVLKTYQIPKDRVSALIKEFDTAGFYDFENSYCCRENSDGTISQIFDAGFADVTTSIDVDGKTKSVVNNILRARKIDPAPAEDLFGRQRFIGLSKYRHIG